MEDKLPLGVLFGGEQVLAVQAWPKSVHQMSHGQVGFLRTPFQLLFKGKQKLKPCGPPKMTHPYQILPTTVGLIGDRVWPNAR